MTKIAENEEGEIYLWSNDRYINWGAYIWDQMKQYRTIDKKKHTELRKTILPQIQLLNPAKNCLQIIRKERKNRYIERITDEIREGQKQGIARIVWRKINAPEKPLIRKQKRKMALKDDIGDNQSVAYVNVGTMGKYIKQHFTRALGKWAITCIVDEMWTIREENDETWNIANEHKNKHDSSHIQQYAKTGINKKQYVEATGRDIQGYEIQKDIRKLNNGKSVGSDEISDGAIKINKDWVAPILKQMFNRFAHNNAIPKEWAKGIMTLLHKKDETDQLDNYRPIALINVIYKIWAFVMSTRLNPVITY